MIPPTHAAAIIWLLRHVAVSDDELDGILAISKKKAAMVAGIALLAVIQRVKDSITDAKRYGIPLDVWKRQLRTKLRPFLSGHRVEGVTATATQTAYIDGRHARLTHPAVLRARPFWLFDRVKDGRNTPICKALGGTILPASHPFWQSHYPPLHPRCRSIIRAVSASAAERMGVSDPDKVKGTLADGRGHKHRSRRPLVTPGFGKVPADDYRTEAARRRSDETERRALERFTPSLAHAFRRKAKARRPKKKRSRAKVKTK